MEGREARVEAVEGRPVEAVDGRPERWLMKLALVLRVPVVSSWIHACR